MWRLASTQCGAHAVLVLVYRRISLRAHSCDEYILALTTNGNSLAPREVTWSRTYDSPARPSV